MPYSHDPEPDLPAVPPHGAPAEPLLSVGGVVAVASALLALLVAVGLPVNDDVQAKLMAFIIVIAPLIVAGIGRLHVWSPKTVRQVVDAEKAKAATRGGAA